MTRRIYDAARAEKPFADGEIFSEVMASLAELKVNEVCDAADLAAGMTKLSGKEAERLAAFPEKLVNYTSRTISLGQLGIWLTWV